MRGNLAAFRRWAPDNVVWAQWAKPVMFANMTGSVTTTPDPVPTLDWILRVDPETAIVVDLPGERGVLEGLALARLGYRPVPLYNGVRGAAPSATLVPVDKLEDALLAGAEELSRLRLPLQAPPAFLLDADRLNQAGKRPGMYDNRWCVFPQDMPSAAFLRSKGIRRVAVRADTVMDDLKHVLHRYAEQGIGLVHHDGKTPRDITQRVKPYGFGSLFYRLGVLLGLRPNAAGGFGGIIPEPSQSHGHGFG